MAEVAISYGNWRNNGLKDAGKTSKKVAKKLDDYDGELNRKIYSKLNNYKGESSDNIRRALSYVQSKRSELDSDSTKYTNYGDALDNLAEQCEDVDKKVARRINTLSSDFKDVYSITTNFVVDAIDYLFTKAKNGVTWYRKLGDQLARMMGGVNDFMNRLKNWYSYHGGREVLKGIGVALLEIGIAIAACVATIATLGTGLVAVVVAVAAITSLAIAVGDGLCNIENEVSGFLVNEDDPVQAKRLHDRNTMADSIVGDATENISARKKIADGIKKTKMVSDTVVMVYSVTKMGQSVLKWGGAGEGASLGTQIKSVGVKAKDNVTKLINTTQNGDLVKCGSKYLLSDLKSNLISNYAYKADSRLSAAKNMKYTANCAKNWMSLGKDLLTGEWNTFDTGVDFALSNFTAFNTNIDKATGDLLEWKTLGDVKSAFEKTGKINNNLFSSNGMFASSEQGLSISVPQIDLITFDAHEINIEQMNSYKFILA